MMQRESERTGDVKIFNLYIICTSFIFYAHVTQIGKEGTFEIIFISISFIRNLSSDNQRNYWNHIDIQWI